MERAAGRRGRRGAHKVEIAPRIVLDERVCAGKPVIWGSRVLVEVVLGHLAAGDTVEDVAKDYGLQRDDVLAALAYAARTVADERVRPVD